MDDISSRDIAAELGINEREAAALQEALADREAAEVNASLPAEAEEFAARELDERAAALAAKVSQAAFDLIIQHETGGRNYYEKVYGGHPVWPGGASGVTTGFGYDLGYVSAAEFQTDWAALGQTVIQRFINAHTIGITGSKSSAAGMKALCRGLRDIVIT